MSDYRWLWDAVRIAKAIAAAKGNPNWPTTGAHKHLIAVNQSMPGVVVSRELGAAVDRANRVGV